VDVAWPPHGSQAARVRESTAQEVPCSRERGDLGYSRVGAGALIFSKVATEAYVPFCGQLPVDWYFCEAADPQAKGVVERLQGYLETNFEPGRRFANQPQLPAATRRLVPEGQRSRHKILRARRISKRR